MRSWRLALMIATTMAVHGCSCEEDVTEQQPDLGPDEKVPGAEPIPDLGPPQDMPTPPDVAAEPPPPDVGPGEPPIDGPAPPDGLPPDMWAGDGPSQDALLSRSCDDVEPPAGSIGLAVQLIVTGDGFDLAGAQLQLVQADPPNNVFPIAPVTVTNLDADSDGEQASATIPPNTLPRASTMSRSSPAARGWTAASTWPPRIRRPASPMSSRTAPPQPPIGW